MNPEWRSRYEVMVEAARAAGQVALSYFEQDVAVEWKLDLSPVTVADRAAEQSLRASITAAFPNDGFLGEEFGHMPSSTGYRWIIDPIDGTRCFVRSIPHWATLVGLEYRGEMIAGVSYAPADNQLFRALRGDGSYKNDRRVRVSDVASLDQSLACYSGIQYFQKAGLESRFLDVMRGVDERESRVLHVTVGRWPGEVEEVEVDLLAICRHARGHAWPIAGVAVVREEQVGAVNVHHGDGMIVLDRVVRRLGRLDLVHHGVSPRRHAKRDVRVDPEVARRLHDQPLPGARERLDERECA